MMSWETFLDLSSYNTFISPLRPSGRVLRGCEAARPRGERGMCEETDEERERKFEEAAAKIDVRGHKTSKVRSGADF